MKLLPLLLALLPVLSLHAADPATQLGERGQLLFSDDLAVFNTTAWKVAKGKWEIIEGELHGAEVPADKHGGVVRHLMPMTNVVIQFDVKLDGAKGSSLSINGEKGHICRVSLSPAGFSAQKDDSDHDGPDAAAAFGRVATPLKPGEWHTVLTEIVGDGMVASIDGGKPIAGTHEAIGARKTNFGFTVAGETIAVRKVRVWEATPKADAVAVLAKLVAESPKAAAPAARKPAAK